MNNIYKKIGIKTIINASDTYTIIGGSRMDPNVLKAMAEAAGYFVNIDHLQKKIGEKIAHLTKNEAAYVTSGAGAGLVLSSAACMTYKNPEFINLLPDTTEFPKNEFIMFESQCLDINPYWRLIKLSGCKLIKIKSSLEILKSTINKRTAGIFYFVGSLYEEKVPLVSEVIKVAKDKLIPIIIDAAAQLPPVENMWYFTRDLGADLILFSGGKFIMGPQSTGLILGKKYLIEACCKNGNPNISIGRTFKVGKEEMVAILVAVEKFVNSDAVARTKKFHKMLDYIKKNICGLPGISIIRKDQGFLGQAFPMLFIEFPEGKSNIDCSNFLSNCDPAIDVGYARDGNPRVIFVSPINLKEDELDIVIDGIKKYFVNG